MQKTDVRGRPDVSVVIPVYNAARYLAESIASIRAQTLRSIEIIAVDDGSTDGSGEMLDALAAKDPRLKVFHQTNAGIVGALNNGLAMANGRYVARMDADDIARADRLEKQAAYLDEQPDHVFVGCLFRVIDEAGRPGHVQQPGGQGRQTDMRRFPPYVAAVPHPSLMVRRDAIVSLGGYREQFPHAEDHDLFIRLARLGKMAILPEVLLDYRIHGGAVSTRHAEIQLASALKAQLAGAIVERAGVDAFADGADPSIAELLARYPEAGGEVAWTVLRVLRRVEHDLNRRDPGAAFRSTRLLLWQLLRHVGRLHRSRALKGVTMQTARSALRLGKIAIRG
jgi:glycosyltransferase involved in cell wall biosynthesis